MKTTIEELEDENEVLQSEVTELKRLLALQNESANMWWKKSQELEAKLKALKEIINVI